MIAQEFKDFLKPLLKDALTPAEELAIFIDTHKTDHVMLLLANNGFSRVPVLTKDKKYVGTISMSDIVKYQKEEGVDNEKLAALDISYMTNGSYATVSPNADLTEVMHKLVDANFLPVVEADGKISAVNQFLFFLYENEVLDRFYKIKNKEKLPLLTPAYQEVDLSVLYRETEDSKGQLIALLIVELGLSPSEIIQLKWENIALEFQVLTVVNEKVMRVLEIPQLLLPYLEGEHKAVYLFDNKGEAYSRQWLFQKLNYYLASVDLSQMTAQKLREQYIIKEKNKGTAILDLTRKLGLKSPVTLEKYFKN